MENANVAAEPLRLWCVTHRPSDLPGVEYAARRWELAVDGVHHATADVLTGSSLAAVREQLPPGLTRLERAPDDDPVIVEVWL